MRAGNLLTEAPRGATGTASSRAPRIERPNPIHVKLETCCFSAVYSRSARAAMRCSFPLLSNIINV